MRIRRVIGAAAVTASLLGGSVALAVPVGAAQGEDATQGGASGVIGLQPGPRVQRMIRYAVRTSAEVIGVPTSELVAALRAGETVASVAAAHGVDLDALVATVIEPGLARIDQAVANGRFNAERGEALKGLLAQAATLAANGDYQGAIAIITAQLKAEGLSA